MKRIFSRKHRNSDLEPSRPPPPSNSESGNRRRSLQNIFRSPTSSTTSLTAADTYRFTDQLLDDPNIERELGNGDDGYNDASSVDSTPLSESNTLFLSNQERLMLQPTFQENFSLYLPFLIRRVRYERLHERDDISSSQETVASVAQKYSVLDQPTNNFNEKRGLILVHEFMKNSNLIFASMDSFKLYKELRNLKKDEQHETAARYHSKGLGMPLFKVEAHTYLRLDDGADLIFHRYCELSEAPSRTNSVNPPLGSTSKFCIVHVKSFTSLKRFTFTFTPEDGRTEPFKVILFQHNFKPIADFNFKNTRFRIFGNSLVNFGLAPNLKLLVIDKDKPSLCDSIIDKPQFKLLSIVRRRKSSAADTSGSISRRGSASNERRGSASSERRGSASSERRGSVVSTTSVNMGEGGGEEADAIYEGEEGDVGETDPLKMANPYPDKSNPLLMFDQNQYLALNKTFVSNDMPPFGNFQDAVCYLKDFSLLPKKFKEQGRFEVYQDLSRFPSDINLNSTSSLDLDSLVLCCISVAVREMVVRRNSKISSNMEAVNRYNYMGAGLYSTQGPGLLGGL